MKYPVPRGVSRRTTPLRPVPSRPHHCRPPQAGHCARCRSPIGPSHRYCAGCGLRLESPARPESPVRRRMVSVLFVDMVGFTELAARLEPEELHTLQTEYFRSVAAVIRRWGGIVEKYIGDAVMAVFGTDFANSSAGDVAAAVRAEGRHAYRAVRAGLQVVQALHGRRFPHGSPIRVRVGVATGEAVVDLGASDGGQGFVTGSVVNIAFRVQSHATVGTVAVTDATRAATGSLLPYRRLAPVTVAGRSEPLEIWRPEFGTAGAYAGPHTNSGTGESLAPGRRGDVAPGPDLLRSGNDRPARSVPENTRWAPDVPGALPGGFRRPGSVPRRTPNVPLRGGKNCHTGNARRSSAIAPVVGPCRGTDWWCGGGRSPPPDPGVEAPSTGTGRCRWAGSAPSGAGGLGVLPRLETPAAGLTTTGIGVEQGPVRGRPDRHSRAPGRTSAGDATVTRSGAAWSHSRRHIATLRQQDPADGAEVGETDESSVGGQ